MTTHNNYVLTEEEAAIIDAFRAAKSKRKSDKKDKETKEPKDKINDWIRIKEGEDNWKKALKEYTDRARELEKTRGTTTQIYWIPSTKSIDTKCLHEEFDEYERGLPEWMRGQPRMLSCPCSKCSPRYL